MTAADDRFARLRRRADQPEKMELRPEPVDLHGLIGETRDILAEDEPLSRAHHGA